MNRNSGIFAKWGKRGLQTCLLILGLFLVTQLFDPGFYEHFKGKTVTVDQGSLIYILNYFPEDSWRSVNPLPYQRVEQGEAHDRIARLLENKRSESNASGALREEGVNAEVGAYMKIHNETEIYHITVFAKTIEACCANGLHIFHITKAERRPPSSIGYGFEHGVYRGKTLWSGYFSLPEEDYHEFHRLIMEYSGGEEVNPTWDD